MPAVKPLISEATGPRLTPLQDVPGTAFNFTTLHLHVNSSYPSTAKERLDIQARLGLNYEKQKRSNFLLLFN